jgi:hypothetical protein
VCLGNRDQAVVNRMRLPVFQRMFIKAHEHT